MKILLDHNLTRLLKRFLPGHLVRSAAEEGWDRLPDGDMIRTAERHGYEVMITADQEIVHQQNNEKRRLALVVLTSNRRPFILSRGDAVRAAVDRAKPSSFEVVPIPLPAKNAYRGF